MIIDVVIINITLKKSVIVNLLIRDILKNASYIIILLYIR